jgi:hypothetical protein
VNSNAQRLVWARLFVPADPRGHLAARRGEVWQQVLLAVFFFEAAEEALDHAVLLKYFRWNGTLEGGDTPNSESGPSMCDQSISRQARWKVRGRLAKVKYAEVQASSPPRCDSGWIARRLGSGETGREEMVRWVSCLGTRSGCSAGAISTLSSEDCAFFVHIDRKANIREFSRISGDSTFLVEQRTPVYWGEFSQVEATIRLIEQALSCSVKYDYFVLLHGADYPLRSIAAQPRYSYDSR